MTKDSNAEEGDISCNTVRLENIELQGSMKDKDNHSGQLEELLSQLNIKETEELAAENEVHKLVEKLKNVHLEKHVGDANEEHDILKEKVIADEKFEDKELPEQNTELNEEDHTDSSSENEPDSSSDTEEDAKDCGVEQQVVTREDTDSEEDEEEKYLTRGLISDNKKHPHRYSPVHSSNAPSNLFYQQHHGRLAGRSRDNANSGIFDVIDFNREPARNMQAQFDIWQNQQLNQGNVENGQIFPSGSGAGNCYQNYDPLSFNQCTGHREVQNDGWNNRSPMHYGDNSCDYSNNSFAFYQPPTPPKSVSPPLMENLNGNQNQLHNNHENYNVRKSEDLINIINAINKANKTETGGIPEAELEKLRSVLECTDDFTRHEMGMYLAVEEAAIQDCYSDCSSPSVSLGQDDSNTDDDLLCSEDYLTDIIKGINEINPEELNIYLENEKKIHCDLSYARTWLQNKCKPNALDHALRRLSQISTKMLCKKDADGDTCLMIVYSKPEDSPDFYENVFCLQERLREIKVCCDIPLGKAKRCKSCGNTDPEKFYTPLSFKNNQGFSALCCAVKMNLSKVMVDYLLDGILQNEEDTRRVFDELGKRIFDDVCQEYPRLIEFI